MQQERPIADRPARGWRVPTSIDSLRDRNFALFLLASTFSSVPMAANQVTQGFLAFQLSGSATGLGLVTLAWGAPQVFLTAFAGVLADRFERRRILMVTQSATGILTVLTAVLIHLGLIEVWHLVAIGFVQGSFFAFNMPARQGMTSDVVSHERLIGAIAMNNTLFQLTRIGAPAAAGALIAFPAIGIGGAYDMLAVCSLLASVVLVFVRSRPMEPRRRDGTVLGELASAWRYIVTSPVHPKIMLMALVPIVIAMPFQMTAPAFAETMFAAGPTGLGLLMTMTGVGSLIGSLATVALADARDKTRIQVFAVFGLGVSLILFAVNRDFPIALGLITIFGACSNLYMSLNSAQMMAATDRAFLGRVIGIYMLTWSLTPITTLPISAALDAWGPTATFVALGTAVILASVAIQLFGRGSAPAPRETTPAPIG